ncbi:YIP1 family protein [Anaeromyxobacter terrae]|uniref:YIP1 family protein n=1 Tax=Anaeromyxobacter terrae TaxID=2925406 RepID=UPI001F57D14F|nr:Yip1 family protein [Anaeromyxobacter sp. SG22]
MIARCARCQGTFQTDRFGRQSCPHCGAELLLADPNAPPPAAPGPGPVAPAQPEARPAAGEAQGAAAPGPEAPQEPPPSPTSPEAPAPEPGWARTSKQPVWGAPPTPPEQAAGRGPELPPPPGPPSGGYGPPPGGWGPPPGGWGPPPGGWGPPPGGGWGPPPAGPPGPQGPEAPAPFAERKQRGLFSSFLETLKLVATQPGAFFRRVRVDQPGSAVLFAVIAYTVGTLFQGLYNLATGSRVAEIVESVAENMPEEQARYLRMYVESLSGSSAIAQVVLAPLAALVGVYLWAAIVHGILLLVRGAPRGFGATLTAVGYAAGLNVLLIVPGCGGFLALVWSVVAMIIGLGETQRCGPGKSTLAVLSPLLLVLVCSCCAAIGLGFGGMLQGGRGHGPVSL